MADEQPEEPVLHNVVAGTGPSADKLQFETLQEGVQLAAAQAAADAHARANPNVVVQVVDPEGNVVHQSGGLYGQPEAVVEDYKGQIAKMQEQIAVLKDLIATSGGAPQS